MRAKGRWVAAAQALIVFVCLDASCAALEEGANWSSIAPSSADQSTSYAWEKVTAVLQEARENGTFPGTSKLVHLYHAQCKISSSHSGAHTPYCGRGSFCSILCVRVCVVNLCMWWVLRSFIMNHKLYIQSRSTTD